MSGNLKHIVLFSGGHSSAIVAIKVVERFGKENCILLNHNINISVEDEDIKRFKEEVSEYLGMEITYSNMEYWDSKDQFDVCVEAKAFKTKDAPAICTSRMKTEPFLNYLKNSFPEKNCVLYYGFDANEINRIVRRTYIMGLLGYKTEYPIAQWAETVRSTEDVGIVPPLKYKQYKHANCTGCLKGGSQHWYVVYCTRPDIFKKAKESEEKIGYAILGKNKFLKDVECDFFRMRELGVEPTEHVPFQTFWANAKKILDSPSLFNLDTFTKSCECQKY